MSAAMWDFLLAKSSMSQDNDAVNHLPGIWRQSETGNTLRVEALKDGSFGGDFGDGLAFRIVGTARSGANIRAIFAGKSCYYRLSFNRVGTPTAEANFELTGGDSTCFHGTFARTDAPTSAVAASSDTELDDLVQLLGNWRQSNQQLAFSQARDVITAALNGAALGAVTWSAEREINLKITSGASGCEYLASLSDDTRLLKLDLRRGSGNCPRGVFEKVDQATRLKAGTAGTSTSADQQFSGDWINSETGDTFSIGQIADGKATAQYQSGQEPAKSGTVVLSEQPGQPNLSLRLPNVTCNFIATQSDDGRSLNLQLLQPLSSCPQGVYKMGKPLIVDGQNRPLDSSSGRLVGTWFNPGANITVFIKPASGNELDVTIGLNRQGKLKPTTTAGANFVLNWDRYSCYYYVAFTAQSMLWQLRRGSQDYCASGTFNKSK
ncbi:hypothetical protein JQ543_13760 [Bradyrhizobium diazoefficiens]|nr:hypothetical protein [Bradyrhizobium diazoefficiens]MBR0848814.1 hypothetical protein [Bradyrhizobium diazoefficiens]